MTSKQKGGIGVAAAIAHFALKGDLVYVPITETGCDLVIERSGVLMRVEVKSTWHPRGRVDLRTNAGFYNQRNIKQGKFNSAKVDLVIAYNANTQVIAEFPSTVLHDRSSITVK